MFVSDIRASEDRSPWGDFFFEPVSVRTGSGQRVNADTAMRLTAVYGCVRVLAETMACLPFCLYRENSQGGKDQVKDHWLYRLLAKRPNSWQNPFEWMEMMQGHLALRGRAYNLIIDDRKGGIEQLIPLHPDRTQLELLDNGSFRYRFKDRAGNETIYPRQSIWHLRGLSADGYEGLNPIAIARESIGVGLAAQDYGARFFANDAKPTGGWIEFPGEFKDKTARDTFKESWQETQAGVNRGKLAVLDRGMQYHEIGLNNVDSQFLEARQFQVPEICRIFRVPPHMVADLSRSTNNNIEWQSLEFVKFCMTPWAERWEASVEYSLLPDDDGLEVEFDFDNLERGDMKTRGVFYTAGINAGWMTRNEARKKENMNPIDGLDEPLQPLNMVVAGEDPAEPNADDPNADPNADPNVDPNGDPKGLSTAATVNRLVRLVSRVPGLQAHTAIVAPNDVRLQVLAMAAAERVARKETELMVRAGKGGPAETAAAYAKHAQFVSRCLAVSLESAQAYCAEQLASLENGELPESFETRTRCKLERLALDRAGVCTQGEVKP